MDEQLKLNQELEDSWKMQFIGQYHQTMDSKGRIVLPSTFKEILIHYYGGEVGINTSFEDPDGKLLIVFPLPVLARRLNVIRELMSKNENMRYLFEHYSGSIRGTIDSQGRIVVPQQLRSGRLNKNIVVHGRLDTIVLWDMEYFENKFRPESEELENIKETLRNSGNLDLLF